MPCEQITGCSVHQGYCRWNLRKFLHIVKSFYSSTFEYHPLSSEGVSFISHNLFLSLKPLNTHPSKRANCKVTHRLELGTFSRVPSTSKKTNPKLPNQNHPSNICKTFHGVFERYYSFWKKIKTDVVISTNLQSCMGDYLWYYEQFDFQFHSIGKNPSALLNFIFNSAEKILGW